MLEPTERPEAVENAPLSEPQPAAASREAPPSDAVGDRAAVASAPAGGRWIALYPNLYVWFIFLASLDVMCTYLILHPSTFPARVVAAEFTAEGQLIFHQHEVAGSEVNPLAAWVIDRGGVPGKVAYKFALVLMVIGVCEIVGRRRPATGLRLAEWSVALTAIPVVVGIVQLAVYASRLQQ